MNDYYDRTSPAQIFIKTDRSSPFVVGCGVLTIDHRPALAFFRLVHLLLNLLKTPSEGLLLRALLNGERGIRTLVKLP